MIEPWLKILSNALLFEEMQASELAKLGRFFAEVHVETVGKALSKNAEIHGPQAVDDWDTRGFVICLYGCV